MIVKQLNPGHCKTYLVKADHSNDIILIDPLVDYIDLYKSMIIENSFRLTHIIDTHTHADHVSGAPAMKDIYNFDYIMHKNAKAPCIDVKLEDEDEMVFFGNVKAQFIFTPGHNQDSITIVFPESIFSGDTLFLDEGGAGRDDLPGGDPGQHFDSLQKLLELDEEMMVYPGHEYRDIEPTTLQLQKKNNPFLQLKTRDEYIRYLNNLKLGAAEWMIDVVRANKKCAKSLTGIYIPKESSSCESLGTLCEDWEDYDIDVFTSKELNAQDDLDQMIFVDVRDIEELQDIYGIIPNSIHIPIDEILNRIEELMPYKEKKIVLICELDPRAFTAAILLESEGIENTIVLKGGIKNWVEEGFKTLSHILDK